MMGTSAEDWYYAGRDHIFFAVEAAIHHGGPSALGLPPEPPGLRERLTGSRELTLTRVTLLKDQLVKRRAHTIRRIKRTAFARPSAIGPRETRSSRQVRPPPHRECP
jgi:hypothetical protein